MPGKNKQIGRTLIFAMIVFGFIGFAAGKSFAAPVETAGFDGETEAKIEAFIKDFDAVSKEMESAIDGSSTTAGIDSAQKAFDAKKDSLREQFNVFKDVRLFQLNDAVVKKLTDSIIRNGKAITDAFSKHATDYAEQPEEASTKFRKLIKDYTDLFKMN